MLLNHATPWGKGRPGRRGGPGEGEALDKARFFVLGCSNLIIAVDHKPLRKVFTDRSLEILNAKLRNLIEKTLPYKFCMVHIPGIRHKAADALSRHPTGPTNPDMTLPPDAIATSGVSAIPSLFNPSRHPFLTAIRYREPPASYTTTDDELVSLVSSSLSTLAITWDHIKVATETPTQGETKMKR